MRTSKENALFRNHGSISIQSNNWVQFLRRLSSKLFISFNLDFWKIMKLLFLLLLCVVILARSSRSPSFDVRLHGSSSIPIASFVERGLFIKTFCHRKYLNRRIVYSSDHQGTFNPAVITNKEVHMVHGNINKYERRDFTCYQ